MISHSNMHIAMIRSCMLLASTAVAYQLPNLSSIPQWQLQSRSLQQIVGFADPEVCYPALATADANDNGLVDADEYVTFVQGIGPAGFLEDITSFEDLPLQLQSNFNVIVCLCQSDPADDSCCVGEGVGIMVDGARASDTPTAEQESYLFIVCSLTASAVQRVLQTVAPTASPSDSPSLPLSEAPSAAPTISPTISVTDSPSAAPTEVPTVSPTVPPTGTPTALPTTTPTAAPTASPTTTPTVAPGVPTAQPTVAPPTVAPGEPTAQPTTSPPPTQAPTTAVPTQVPIEATIVTVYRIRIRNRASRTIYEAQLIDAMDSLAPEVLASISSRRRLRRLQSVEFPTVIDNFSPIGEYRIMTNRILMIRMPSHSITFLSSFPPECPEGIPDGDVCEVVTAFVTVIFQPNEPTQETTEQFAQDLDDSIQRGQLKDALDFLFPGNDVDIIDDTLRLEDEEDRTISDATITGIVIGSFAAIVLLGFLASRRVPPSKEDEQLQAAPVQPEKDISPEEPHYEEPPDVENAAVLGATTPDYGKVQDAMMDNDDAIANMSVDSSSNAGSSGWSSSAGVSSLNTGSQDGLSADGPIAAFGSTLAALGMTTPEKGSAGKDGGAPQTVTRADLDSAIESGDWAAVGATAALLAAASDSQSYSSHSRAMESQSRASDTTSIDAARAAELDHLVESGDWEGVVLAAAKFEAAESGSESRASDSRASASASASASVSSSASKSKRRQEMRQEVEDLVRRVVPEEIQNVDEMMSQFRGREEELIETLRTMEERAVAQKARQGAQKQAKVQAKLKTPEERKADVSTLLSAIGGPGSPDSAAVDGESFQDSASHALSSKSLGTGQVTSAAKSLGTGQVIGTTKSKSLGIGTIDTEKTPSQHDRKQSALEEAIRAGDWEAVGQAAAMLSDHSLASSVETDEINRLADGLSSGSSVTESSKGNLSDKAEELEAMIERGDWTGVVNAAAKKSNETSDKDKKETEEEARRRRRLKHLKEEEEALAQAQIWEAIAQQTKQEAEQTSTDQAASAAADWAIGRSLQALVQAEQGDQLTREEDSSKADTSTKTDDEEEV